MSIPDSEKNNPTFTVVPTRLLHDTPISSPIADTGAESTTTQALPHDPLPNNVPIKFRPEKLPTKPAPPARITRQQTARQLALAYGALNLAADGCPLTYSKAKSGPDAALWLQAESEEFDRRFDSRQYLLYILSTSPNVVGATPPTSIPKPNKRLKQHIAFGALLAVTVSTTADRRQRKQRR